VKPRSPWIAAASLVALSACAASPDDAKGLWQTADKNGVLEFKPCEKNAAALCGRVAWDKDAGTLTDTYGVQVAELKRYDGDAWRDGWIFDPRDKRKYKGALRVKVGELHIRAFVGAEILGQTEQLTRIAALPDAPTCKKS
jgi:uncharacterized protein (DUF2147 family)